MDNACSFDAGISTSDHRPVAMHASLPQDCCQGSRAVGRRGEMPKFSGDRTYRRRLPLRWGLRGPREKDRFS